MSDAGQRRDRWEPQSNCTISPLLEVLFERIQKRNMEDPPITWAAVQDWGTVFEPPTPEEMGLFDPHFCSDHDLA